MKVKHNFLVLLKQEILVIGEKVRGEDGFELTKFDYGNHVIHFLFIE